MTRNPRYTFWRTCPLWAVRRWRFSLTITEHNRGNWLLMCGPFMVDRSPRPKG